MGILEIGLLVGIVSYMSHPDITGHNDRIKELEAQIRENKDVKRPIEESPEPANHIAEAAPQN